MEIVAFAFWGYIAYRIYRFARGDIKLSPERAANEERWLNSPTDADSALRQMRVHWEAGEFDEAIRLGRDVRSQEQFRDSDRGLKLRKRAMRSEGRKPLPPDYKLIRMDPSVGEPLLVLSEMMIEVAVKRKDGDMAMHATDASWAGRLWFIKKFHVPMSEQMERIPDVFDRSLRVYGIAEDLLKELGLWEEEMKRRKARHPS